jgi:hypothetical protein
VNPIASSQPMLTEFAGLGFVQSNDLLYLPSSEDGAGSPFASGCSAFRFRITEIV